MNIAASSISNSVNENIDRYKEVLWRKQQNNVDAELGGSLLKYKLDPYAAADLMEKNLGLSKIRNGSLNVLVKICGIKSESIKNLESTDACILSHVDLTFLKGACSYSKLFFGMNIWCMNCYSSLRGCAFES